MPEKEREKGIERNRERQREKGRSKRMGAGMRSTEKRVGVAFAMNPVL